MKNQPKTEWARTVSLDLALNLGESCEQDRAKIEAALLKAVDCGRKETIEDISDVISEHQEEDHLQIVWAVVQYIDKSRLDLRKANGK